MVPVSCSQSHGEITGKQACKEAEGSCNSDLIVPQQQVKHTPCRASSAAVDATMLAAGHTSCKGSYHEPAAPPPTCKMSASHSGDVSCGGGIVPVSCSQQRHLSSGQPRSKPAQQAHLIVVEADIGYVCWPQPSLGKCAGEPAAGMTCSPACLPGALCHTGILLQCSGCQETCKAALCHSKTAMGLRGSQVSQRS